MGKVAEEIIKAVNATTPKITEYMRTIDQDQEAAMLLAQFAAGSAESAEFQIRQNVPKRGQARRNMNELAMNLAADGFLKGIVIGLRMAESGARFEVTPGGIKLHTGQEPK